MGNGSVHLAPEEATRRGLIVSSWHDPAEIAVELWNGSRVMLTADGQYGTEK